LLRSSDCLTSQGGDELANGIARLLRYNPSLTSLSLDGNDFTLHSFKTLLHYLQRNKSVVYLPFQFLDVNAIYPDSATERMQLDCNGDFILLCLF
jgi:hypothetical protein